MKLQPFKISLTLGIVSLIGLAGCNNIPRADDLASFIPAQCSMPDGVEVVSLSLDDNQAGDIGATATGYDVTVELNRPLVRGEAAVICYVVRDKQFAIQPVIIAAGFAGVLEGQGSTVTRANSFSLGCDAEGEVVGAQTINMIAGLNDTSKERSTKVFIQEVKGVTSFANIPTGIDGVKSNKIRVSCN